MACAACVRRQRALHRQRRDQARREVLNAKRAQSQTESSNVDDNQCKIHTTMLPTGLWVKLCTVHNTRGEPSKNPTHAVLNCTLGK